MIFGEELKKLPKERRAAHLSKKEKELNKLDDFAGGLDSLRISPYRRAASDQGFVDSLEMAKYRVEGLFRRIEALRVFLAKHEKPSGKRSIAVAPGSGRIDMRSGSIQWFVSLEDNEVDMVSRREIADQCRDLSVNRKLKILPKNLRKIVGQFPRVSYGTWCVSVELDDDSVYSGVIVRWAQEVVTAMANLMSHRLD